MLKTMLSAYALYKGAKFAKAAAPHFLALWYAAAVLSTV